MTGAKLEHTKHGEVEFLNGSYMNGKYHVSGEVGVPFNRRCRQVLDTRRGGWKSKLPVLLSSRWDYEKPRSQRSFGGIGTPFLSQQSKNALFYLSTKSGTSFRRPDTKKITQQHHLSLFYCCEGEVAEGTIGSNKVKRINNGKDNFHIGLWDDHVVMQKSLMLHWGEEQRA